MKNFSIKQLTEKADQIRKNTVDVAVISGAGHIAPSLSCVDILVSLYYSVLNVSSDSEWDGRDRLVFSKAHGCYGLYAILADIGYVKKEDWQNFYKGSFLSGCVERSTRHGLEIGCGSLGHGLPMAVGMAFGAKLQDKNYQVYCIVGDGEMQEGSNWEAIQFAVKHKLSNIAVIVDHNKVQAMDFLENILTPKGAENDLRHKLEAFGFIVGICDGHNIEAIIKNTNKLIAEGVNKQAPIALIAETVKGYGLKCMENVPKFHFRVPDKEDLMMGTRYE